MDTWRGRHSVEPIIDAGAARSTGTREILEIEADHGWIRLELVMDENVAEQRDEIFIDALPAVHAELRGGVFGDDATAAIVLNYIPLLVDAPPGLLTIADLPMPGGRG